MARRVSLIDRVFNFAGLLGIPALFLPFTYDASPARAALDHDFWRVGAPFFLSLLVSSAALRWALSGTLSLLERRILYFVSGVMASVTIRFVIEGWPSSGEDRLFLAIPVVTLVLGVCLVIRNWRREAFREVSAVMSMQIAYLANCFLCLAAFFPDWQIGASFALGTAVVYSAQIAVISTREAPDQPFVK